MAQQEFPAPKYLFFFWIGFAKAHNGAEALLSALVRRPDIILTDVMMPEMDGLELCRRIRKEEQLQDLPIILVTARGRFPGAGAGG